MTTRDFLLPDLGEGLEDAEIVAWRVAEGETVVLNQVLVEVNTAKALVEIPSPWAGAVERLHGGEGDVVRVGAPLVSIQVEGAEAVPVAAPEPVGTTETAEAAEAPTRRAVLVGYGVDEVGAPKTGRRRFGNLARTRGAPPARSSAQSEAHFERSPEDRPSAPGPAPAAGPVRATPPVRRLARELGIDLASVAATGPNGRVTREDVQRAAPAQAASAGRPPSPPREDRRLPVRGIRRLIADKMTRSVREIPHVTTFLTLDATNLQAFRAHVERDTGERVSPLPVVVASLAQTIEDHPKLNASFDADASEILLHGTVHAGIATDTEQGLVVTVVRDADRRGLLDIAGEIARLSDAARAGRARPGDVTGSTITVSNVGSFGAEYGTPIINHPEGAILAIGVIEPRALVVDGRVEARPALTLSLSFDHRLMDGAEAGRALRALADLLEDPFRLGRLAL